MSKEKRRDATQKIFNAAAKFANNHNLFIYGFGVRGAAFLTSDKELFEQIQLMLKYQNIDENEIIHIPFDGLYLVNDQTLKTCYSNALFFKQETYFDKQNLELIGGNVTLILSSTPDELQFFPRYVIEKHCKDFNINVNKSSFIFGDEPVATLKIEMSVNNKKVITLSNRGDYNSRLLFHLPAKDINSAINNTSTETQEEFEK